MLNTKLETYANSTVAHISHVAVTIGFFRLAKMYGTSDWEVIGGSKPTNLAAKERRKRRLCCSKAKF